MIDKEASYLAVISAIVIVVGHEWLHASSITDQIPNITGTTTAAIDSVSVGLAALVAAGVTINAYVYQVDD
ncbi:hypothetical protein GRX03_11945 [Halovenus sp. WSH3]|uniref:Uncharacterized protein n=1 Tax=Halovenus carboxidivorans TaxID=2692199 RepID=A0A6B0TAP5_9EURY|nr:hypothetical protein [Halovenus carboxidivorans]MXR52311.1 hypothetical protein [Halovenus carboxidivorans]